MRRWPHAGRWEPTAVRGAALHADVSSPTAPPLWRLDRVVSRRLFPLALSPASCWFHKQLEAPFCVSISERTQLVACLAGRTRSSFPQDAVRHVPTLSRVHRYKVVPYHRSGSAQVRPPLMRAPLGCSRLVSSTDLAAARAGGLTRRPFSNTSHIRGSPLSTVPKLASARQAVGLKVVARYGGGGGGGRGGDLMRLPHRPDCPCAAQAPRPPLQKSDWLLGEKRSLGLTNLNLWAWHDFINFFLPTIERFCR